MSSRRSDAVTPRPKTKRATISSSSSHKNSGSRGSPAGQTSSVRRSTPTGGRGRWSASCRQGSPSKARRLISSCPTDGRWSGCDRRPGAGHRAFARRRLAGAGRRRHAEHRRPARHRIPPAQHQLVGHVGADSRADGGADPAGARGTDGRCGARAAHRLRQRRESPARAEHCASARNRAAVGARRRTLAADSPATHRKPPARRRRWGGRTRAGICVSRGAARARRRSNPRATARSSGARPAGSRLHVIARSRHRRAVRVRPRAHLVAQRERLAARRRAARWRASFTACARGARRRRGCAVAGAARRRRTAHPELHEAARASAPTACSRRASSFQACGIRRTRRSRASSWMRSTR